MGNPVADYAARQMRYWCDTELHGGVGYSQPNRWTAYQRSDWAGNLLAPGEMDCSSGTGGSYNIAFHEVLAEAQRPEYFPPSTWTGSQRTEAIARGFQDIGHTWTGNVPTGGFQPGDILFVEPGHVAMAVFERDGSFRGDNPCLAEAWQDRLGDIMGSAGADGSPADDTKSETRVVRYSDHPFTRSSKWTTCIRYVGASGRASSSQIDTSAGLTWGVDISMHQPTGGFPDEAQCVIIKATEGVGYEDPRWRAHAKAAWDAGKAVGFYHFARPDLGNRAEDEAAWFLSVVKDWLGYAVLVLDWEREPLGDVGWARRFLDTVWHGSPTRPWVYMNLSTASSHAWEPVSEHYPLWMASYDGRAWDDRSGPHPGRGWQQIGKQYTEDPIDKNTFYFPLPGWVAATKGRDWPTTATNTEEQELMSIKQELVDTWLSPIWDKAVEIKTEVLGLKGRLDVIEDVLYKGSRLKDGVWRPGVIQTVVENQRRINQLQEELAELKHSGGNR